MIEIIAVGKIKESYLTLLINDYLKRINKYHKTIIKEVKDSNNQKRETESILNIIQNKDYVIVLDILGEELNSLDLAKKINNIFTNYAKIIFVIGSSVGLSKEVKKRANLTISFGKVTFPHGLFRGILLEQIYRSFKINNNEEYHK